MQENKGALSLSLKIEITKVLSRRICAIVRFMKEKIVHIFHATVVLLFDVTNLSYLKKKKWTNFSLSLKTKIYVAYEIFSLHKHVLRTKRVPCLLINRIWVRKVPVWPNDTWTALGPIENHILRGRVHGGPHK